jgi:hypothetical protein
MGRLQLPPVHSPNVSCQKASGRTWTRTRDLLHVSRGTVAHPLSQRDTEGNHSRVVRARAPPPRHALQRAVAARCCTTGCTTRVGHDVSPAVAHGGKGRRQKCADRHVRGIVAPQCLRISSAATANERCSRRYYTLLAARVGIRPPRGSRLETHALSHVRDSITDSPPRWPATGLRAGQPPRPLPRGPARPGRHRHGHSALWRRRTVRLCYRYDIGRLRPCPASIHDHGERPKVGVNAERGNDPNL